MRRETYDPSGNLILVEEIDLPSPAASPDVVAIADQVAALNNAVDMLILNELGL